MRTDARNALFDKALAVLEGLGFHVAREDWRYGTICDATVKLGRSTVGTVYFSAGREQHSLSVHAPNSGTSDIIGSWYPNIGRDEIKALDDFEALFRALLVDKRKLPFVEYPTTRSLRAWALSVASIALPGEAPAQWLASSAKGERYVRLARDLAPSGSRAELLKLHASVSGDQAAEAALGRFDDRGLGYAGRSADIITATRYGRASLAWERGSMSYFLHPIRQAPARDVAKIRQVAAPEPELEESLAPGMALA